MLEPKWLRALNSPPVRTTYHVFHSCNTVCQSACQCGMLLTPPTSRAISLRLQGCSARTPFYFQPTITSTATTSRFVFWEVGNGLAFVGCSSTGPLVSSEALIGTCPLVFVPIPVFVTGCRLYVPGPRLPIILISTVTSAPRGKCATVVRGTGTISTLPSPGGRN